MRTIEQAYKIVEDAIQEWQPVAVVCSYSGGYDSLVMTHLVQQRTPTPVWSIDTMLSADGWTEYVTSVAKQFGWQHSIYANESGYQEFEHWVAQNGCPRAKIGHNRAYTRLKDRAFAALLRHYKTSLHDKVLFLSGIRRSESTERMKLTQPIQRSGHSNAIFANPLFYWSDRDVIDYRIEHDLPENPFYATVKGSGDCQCNWGNFITLQKLQKYSPVLASGRVAMLDRLSRESKGYGWDGKIEGQQEMSIEDEHSESPFLCLNCSRDKGDIVAASEYRYFQSSVEERV